MYILKPSVDTIYYPTIRFRTMSPEKTARHENTVQINSYHEGALVASPDR